MIIKVKTETEIDKEITLPYFTRSEYGTLFGHYSETETIMVSSSRSQVSILGATNGFEYPEIKQTEFESGFNKAMTNILKITNNPI